MEFKRLDILCAKLSFEKKRQNLDSFEHIRRLPQLVGLNASGFGSNTHLTE